LIVQDHPPYSSRRELLHVALTPWITSATQSLEPQSALAANTDGFSYTVPAFSVVTFAGTLQKISMCHNGNAISVDINAVPAHLAIGDRVGRCPQ
jgi:hypothetical protein